MPSPVRTIPALSLPRPTPPSADLVENFAGLPLPFANRAAGAAMPEFPQSLREPTLDLASWHLMCSVALTGVLALQAGRWWAEQADVDEDDGEAEDDVPSPSGEDTGAETDGGAKDAKEPLRRREKARS